MQQAKTMDGNVSPNNTDRFLWWLSTAEPELIADCVVDRNRYRIVGITVASTWLFATLAWTYFFSTTVDSPFAFVPLGIFMGWVVLSIDRALIKGIGRAGGKTIGTLVLRMALALTIGLFMAQPAVLYLFDKEVKMQTSLDNETRKQAKRAQLDSLYAGQKQEIQQAVAGLQQQLQTSYNDMLNAQRNYLAETDGTGGSGKVGISVIALAKKGEYERLEQLYRQQEAQVRPKMDTLESRLRQIEVTKQQAEIQFASLLNNGFLTRIEAMQNLISGNRVVAFRYYLIVALLMLIELMPVIVKSLLPAGPYENLVRLTEEAEQELARVRIGEQQASEMELTRRTSAANAEAIDQLMRVHPSLAEHHIDQMRRQWQQDENDSFKEMIRSLKRRVLG
ncbi:MAG TPA: DUF4407 domain-containing protein [Phnomibacter sp.]|nr:DUF4407 domain-containing protein [Phnomibacter sp.]